MQKKNSRTFNSLHSTDRLLITFWALLAIVSIAFHARIPYWKEIAAANALAAAVVIALARASRASESGFVRGVHDWAAYPMVLFTYKQLYYIIGPLHGGRDYDGLLIWLDRMLLQGDPTVWLARFAHPWLTEGLQIAYSLFYALFIAMGIELYRIKDLSHYRRFRFLMVYGFLLSYIGYFFLPATGPRFTLHDFSQTEADLPGVFFTNGLRWFINLFESIQPGMSNSEALASAQRDVFPSGHTMMTMVAVVFAYQQRLKVRKWILAVGILLICATVYLRYHYFVDVLAGGALAAICLATAKKARSWFQRQEKFGDASLSLKQGCQ